MRLLTRPLAVLLTLLMVQRTLWNGPSGCGQVGGHDRGVGAAPAHHMAGHLGSHFGLSASARAADGRVGTPCSHPAQTSCCLTMPSCTTAPVFTVGAVTALDLGAGQAATLWPDRSALLSLVAPPDSPPPRV
jgi:hypothetical protein